MVRNGDVIELDTERRRLHLEVSDAELARRKADWKGPPQHLARGYYRLYTDHVMQANRGADLDFLVGKSGAAVPKDNH
jgi:dihydroxy-acid dehydratase